MKKHILTILALLPAFLSVDGQLPLPQVPAELTTTVARADYVARHFYDAMDWSDAAMTAEGAQTQAWADFLSILPYTSGDNATRAVTAFIASVPAPYMDLYADLAEAYLLAPDSELADERLFTAVLGAIAAREDVGKATRAAQRARLDYLRPNAPGELATGFTFGDGDSLASHIGRSPYLLIVFHDPDCDVCHELLGTLSADPQWTALTASGKLEIITPEITPELEEDYPMLYTPSLYLLDSEGRVIIRNVLLDKISASISR